MNKLKNAAAAVMKADLKATHRAAKHRDSTAVRAVGAVSEAADQPPLIALSVATVLVGAVLRRPAILRSGIRMLGSELLATGLKSVVKRSVDRTRPAKAIATGEHRFKRGDSKEHDESSFPSGHTAGAVAVARSIVQERPGATLPAYATAGAVAAAQMPRGKHYVIDTIAGAAIGYAAEAATNAALRIAEAAFKRAVRRSRP